jgi:putative peptidoglycan lipid II flippase
MASERHAIRWAAALMGASILLSRFMGLIRDKGISYLFGASQESDLYFAAFVVPDFINYLLAGGYFSITLIPLLAGYFERDEEDGWNFFSAVFTWALISIVLITVAAMILAGPLARFSAPGIGAAGSLRLAFFLRIIAPAQICFIAGSCITALLYLRKQFAVPALTPLVYNGLIIVFGILFRRNGMEGFCWGVLAGALAGGLILPWAAARKGGLKLRFRLRHPGLRRFLTLALPLMIGQSIVVWDEQLVRIFGSLAGTGAISWLNYARRIMLVPVSTVAQAVGVASFPFLAEMVAKSEFDRFTRTLNETLRHMVTILIPLSVWLVVVSGPAVILVFQQGRFSAQDSFETAWLLRIYLCAATLWGIQQIVGRAFYARQDTLTPVVLGTGATLISVPIFALLVNWLNAAGVALASVISIGLYTALLVRQWLRRYGPGMLEGMARHLIHVVAFSAAACIPAAVAAWWSLRLFGSHLYLSALAAIVASGIAYALVFLSLAVRFAPSLAVPLLRRFKRRDRADAG